ncbi:hypothetical protein SAMN04489712_101393 [Thermomonospora echinospora]|uniref:Uncharacterized protein n=1 Tax=Thermomonospora echinospora TaxID=1992 RepID=A0A1H5SWK7_9ACTN|nr:hypothetical protein [Thermomonospora echinospora]SEF54930.1 hypothetical protein SAMN04489712_101393 [Thermomonospora echinospora]
MTGTMRVPRSRGALSGILLVLLGLWGGLIPFVGPYFDFAFTPDEPWHVTGDRLLLSVAPAAATVLGGLVVLAGANRAVALLGAWLATLGGAWFVVGGPLSVLWDAAGVGAPLGGEGRQVAEQLSFFAGLGAAVIFFGALALGRFSVVGVREARLSEEMAEYDAHRDRDHARDHGRDHERGPFEPPASRDTVPTPVHPQGRYARRPDQVPPPAEPADHRVAGEPGGNHGRV